MLFLRLLSIQYFFPFFFLFLSKLIVFHKYICSREDQFVIQLSDAF